MSLKYELEKNIQEMQIKMSKLNLEIEQFRQEYDEIFLDSEFTPQELATYLQNSENFPPEVWEKIQHEKKRLDEKLTLDFSQLPDLSKIKQTAKEQSSVQSHWIFVR